MPNETGYMFIYMDDVKEDLANLRVPYKQWDPVELINIPVSQVINIADLFPPIVIAVDFDVPTQRVTMRFKPTTDIPPLKNVLMEIANPEEERVDVFDLYYYTTEPDGRTIAYACKMTELTLTQTKRQIEHMFVRYSLDDVFEYDVVFRFEDFIISEEVLAECTNIHNTISPYKDFLPTE